ncbi:MAG TPA: uracil-DNA glycosylase [Gemmata sp.]
MADDAIDLVQQVRAHLDAVRAAGVLFVPRGEPLTRARTALPNVAANGPREGAPAGSTTYAEDPLEVRRRELTVLGTEVARCDKCSELFGTRLQTVFGTGPLDPEVAFVGDAPGAAEDAQGEPFVGVGGPVLGRIIGACGFTRDRVYLFNAIKCRPPKNRPPTSAECANCRDIFRRQFELVKPRHLFALGHFVSKLLTGQNVPLAELRGKVHQYRGVPLVCTHHPDDIERDRTGRLKRETGFDMKLLLTTMGREVPAPK